MTPSSAIEPGGPQLVLVRHGETPANVIKALDTRPPGAPLNERGRAQAERVAEVLARDPVSGVYSSVATRARQTAAPIAARHGLAVRVTVGLHEVFSGDLEGRADHEAREHFERVYAAWVRGELDRRMPGGESALEVRERYLAALDQVWARHENSDGLVVVVSHGAAIRLAAAALLGEFAVPSFLPNAGRVVLTPGATTDPGGWVLKYWEEGAGWPGDVTGGAVPEPDQWEQHEH